MPFDIAGGWRVIEAAAAAASAPEPNAAAAAANAAASVLHRLGMRSVSIVGLDEGGVS
jgi:hypothetical protein